MGVDGINVMARNFVSTDSQESKYSKARQIAARGARSDGQPPGQRASRGHGGLYGC